jgi:hypothetical protein
VTTLSASVYTAVNATKEKILLGTYGGTMQTYDAKSFKMVSEMPCLLNGDLAPSVSEISVS